MQSTVEQKKPKKNKNETKIKLNTSAFRKFALNNKLIKMISPKAIESMHYYLRLYLLKRIIADIIKYIKFKMSETSIKKSFRIVQCDKLQDIIQEYIRHDLSESINIKQDTVVSKKIQEFAFHPLTFRKYINNMTEEESQVKNIQWSSKCMDILQYAIENELYIVMNTCAKLIHDNAPVKRRANLKLTKRDVCFVFEARYEKR